MARPNRLPPRPKRRQWTKIENSLRVKSSRALDAQREAVQFELVDPTSGRPSSAILGPPASAGGLLGASTRPPGQHRNDNLLFRQRTSGADQLLDPSLQTGGRQRLASNAERFASIELLFLISTLMFLVLLALGLAGSYLCLRRHRQALGAKDRAGAILRRKRRHLSSSPVQVQPLAAPAASHPPHRYGAHHHRHLLPATGAAGGHTNRALYANQKQLFVPFAGAPSSPESELSDQVLLPAAPGGALAGGVPTGGSSYTLARRDPTHGYAPPSVVLGRRDELYAGQQVAGRPRPHHQPDEPAPEQHRHRTLGRASTREPLLKLATGSRQQVAGEPHRAQSMQQLDQDQRRAHLGAVWDNEPGAGRAATLARQRLPVRPRQAARPAAPVGRPRQLAREHHFDIRQLHRPASRSGGSASDSEAETNNNHNHWREADSKPEAAQLAKGGRPRLVLKSIEDSFVTNFTEIYEQEYLKRDVTRPLSWLEWRSSQPARPASPSSQSPPSSSSSRAGPGEEEPAGGGPTSGGLRSLTELNVNFAKPPEEPGDEPSERPAVGQSLASEAEPPTTRAGSGGQVEPAARRGSDGEDLVVSPEYASGRDRLRLVSSPTSQDSVSYV